MVIQGIHKKVEQEIIRIAIENGVTRVILFGSRARGDFHRTSDIDLAVQGGNYSKFCLDVEEETSTLLEFDVVNLDGSVQEELLAMIHREGQCVYEKV